MLDFQSFEVLTFDCYGTLIDWESGLLAALQPILRAHGVMLEDGKLLELYGELEAEAEAGPYRDYRTILEGIVGELGERLGFAPTEDEKRSLPESIRDWPPFPDTRDALNALKCQYRLAVISNIDDDLFAGSERSLGVKFDWIITAKQAGSYKPSHNNFRTALQVIGEPEAKILHVAQSLYHDIAPAHQLGWKTVWVNRRTGKAGYGATPPATAQADLVVPDLMTLAKQAQLG
jgi:2-haloacid dehalogenase